MGNSIMYIGVIIGIITAISNLTLAIIAYRQMRFIKKEHLPVLQLKKLSFNTYVLFNSSNHTAFNLNVYYDNSMLPSFYPLNSGEYFEIKIDKCFLDLKQIKSDEEKHSIIVEFDSKYHKSVKANWETQNLKKADLADGNKYKTNRKDILIFK
jgi:hypothetical protein